DNSSYLERLPIAGWGSNLTRRLWSRGSGLPGARVEAKEPPSALVTPSFTILPGTRAGRAFGRTRPSFSHLSSVASPSEAAPPRQRRPDSRLFVPGRESQFLVGREGECGMDSRFCHNLLIRQLSGETSSLRIWIS